MADLELVSLILEMLYISTKLPTISNSAGPNQHYGKGCGSIAEYYKMHSYLVYLIGDLMIFTMRSARSLFCG